MKKGRESAKVLDFVALSLERAMGANMESFDLTLGDEDDFITATIILSFTPLLDLQKDLFLPPTLLQFTLLEGKDLMAVDSSGTSDPYVNIKVNGQKFLKSNVIKKDLNPVWNQSFDIYLNDPRKSVIYLEVRDWNRIDSFEPLGYTVIYPTNIVTKSDEIFCMDLENASKGQLKYKCSFLTIEQVPEKRLEAAMKTWKEVFGEGSVLIDNPLISGTGAILSGTGALIGATGKGAVNVMGATGKGAVNLVGATGKGAIDAAGFAGKGVVNIASLTGKGAADLASGTANIATKPFAFAKKGMGGIFNTKSGTEVSHIESEEKIQDKLPEKIQEDISAAPLEKTINSSIDPVESIITENKIQDDYKSDETKDGLKSIIVSIFKGKEDHKDSLKDPRESGVAPAPSMASKLFRRKSRAM